MFDQHADVVVYRGKQRDEKLFARLVAAGFEAQGCGFFRESGGEGGVVDVDADTGDCGVVDQVRKDDGSDEIIVSGGVRAVGAGCR